MAAPPRASSQRRRSVARPSAAARLPPSPLFLVAFLRPIITIARPAAGRVDDRARLCCTGDEIRSGSGGRQGMDKAFAALLVFLGLLPVGCSLSEPTDAGETEQRIFGGNTRNVTGTTANP